MTIEEALKSIIEDGIELGGGDYVPLETLKVAKEALEKQIKKKPSRKHKFAELYIGYCPNCLEGINSEMEHCDKCGQALDWGEV